MSKDRLNDENEIDLLKMKERINASFDGINMSLFNMLQFFVKNAIALLICVIVGVGLGFYLDRTKKTYNNQIIVTPNFGSVDYLYAKVGLIESKIKEKDYGFLSGIGIKDPEKFLDIEVEPVVDIYALVNRSESNFEMVKLMAEDSDMKKITEDPVTSKNYTFHAITFTTLDKTARSETAQPLLDYFDDSEYYKKMQVEYQNNQRQKMVANEQTIAQINGILSSLASADSGKTSNQVYINQNTQLNDVIKTKDELVKEQGMLRVELINNDKIIKESNVLINIKNTKSVNGKLKFVFPILFVFLFLLVKLFVLFYRKQKLKSASAV